MDWGVAIKHLDQMIMFEAINLTFLPQNHISNLVWKKKSSSIWSGYLGKKVEFMASNIIFDCRPSEANRAWLTHLDWGGSNQLTFTMPIAVMIWQKNLLFYSMVIQKNKLVK